MENTPSETKKHIHVAPQMILTVALVLLAFFGSMLYLMNYFVAKDSVDNAEKKIVSLAQNDSFLAENFFGQAKTTSLVFMDLLKDIDSNEEGINSATLHFFRENPNLGAILLVSFSGDVLSYNEKIVSKDFFQKHLMKEEKFDSFIQSQSKNLKKAFDGEDLSLNATASFEFPAAVLAHPLDENGKKHALVMLVSTEDFLEKFEKDSQKDTYSFLMNPLGEIIVHPDYSLLQKNENLSRTELFSKISENIEKNYKKNVVGYKEENNEYFAAFQNISFGTIVTATKKDSIFENLVQLTKLIAYLSISLFFFALLLTLLFTKVISRKLRNFRISTEETEESDVSEKSSQEENEGESDSAEEPAGSLPAEVSGEKNVTVSYYGLENFKEVSEKVDAEKFMNILNESMEKMNQCAERTGGVSSRFSGDKTLSVWGSVNSKGTSMDALNAVISALLMRSALIEFNKDKETKIRIGCGISTGSVIAGNIGSEGKTQGFVGDTINLASQTENLNKQFGSDILITESTYSHISKLVVAEEMPPIHIKGSTEFIKLYAVINMPKAKNIPGCGEDGPKTLDDVRKLIGSEKTK